MNVRNIRETFDSHQINEPQDLCTLLIASLDLWGLIPKTFDEACYNVP